jgi:Cu2+-exporting ATPase
MAGPKWWRSSRPANWSRRHCLALAAALERGSEHPVGRALAASADPSVPGATELRNTPGSGIEGWIEGRRYRVGRPEFAAGLSAAAVMAERTDLDAASTWVAWATRSGLLAWFQLADSLRPGAAAAVAALRSRGLTVELLSGDRVEAVAHVAGQVAIVEAVGRDVAARQAGAAAGIARARRGGGDGRRWSERCAGAGGGPGVARDGERHPARPCHGGHDSAVGTTGTSGARGGHGSRTLAIMRENFAWAIGYNLIALPLAAGGWLTPWMSALGMSFSSLLVVVNALRLRQS